MSNVLLVGGAGYIGSHTAVELLESGNEVIIVDNFSNADKMVIDRIEKITKKKPKVYEIDTRSNEFEHVFIENKIDAVVDYAAYKSVGDSVNNPLEYYNNNIISLLNTLEYMQKYKIYNFVFSSSATVYSDADAEDLPFKETYPTGAKNPYARTKLMGEMILEDLLVSNKKFNCIVLRYFNPIGAHPSSLIGEICKTTTNIMPHIANVAIGETPYLKVFGDDYETEDGTGVRDYIHVVDLARGHVKAIDRLKTNKVGIEYFNLGTGRGYSVLELINLFSEVSGKNIPYKIVERRSGDVAVSYADSTKAKNILHWESEFDIKQMCVDFWKWKINNPNGYEK